MKVAEVMESPAVTVDPTDSITDACVKLAGAGVAALPVVHGDLLVGIVSEADLFRASLGPAPGNVGDAVSRDPVKAGTVASIMRRPVVTVQATDTVTLCQYLLIRHARSLPVLAGTRVVGTVSRADLLRRLTRADRETRRGIVDQLETGTYPAGWTVEVSNGSVIIGGLPGEAARRAARIARTMPYVRDVTIRPAAVDLVA